MAKPDTSITKPGIPNTSPDNTVTKHDIKSIKSNTMIIKMTSQALNLTARWLKHDIKIIQPGITVTNGHHNDWTRASYWPPTAKSIDLFYCFLVHWMSGLLMPLKRREAENSTLFALPKENVLLFIPLRVLVFFRTLSVNCVSELFCSCLVFCLRLGSFARKASGSVPFVLFCSSSFSLVDLSCLLSRLSGSS